MTDTERPTLAGLLLSAVNLQRCTSADGFNHPLTSWSVAEWTNAVAGEAGEACNLAKKLLRHRDKVAGNKKPEDQDVESLRRRIAEELADVVIYADLAMAAVGYDFATTVRDVFNRKSQELGAPYLIGEGRVEAEPRADLEQKCPVSGGKAGSPICMECGAPTKDAIVWRAGKRVIASVFNDHALREPAADAHNMRERIRMLRSFIMRIGGFCSSAIWPGRYKRDGTLVQEPRLAHDVEAWQKEALAADDELAATRPSQPVGSHGDA